MPSGTEYEQLLASLRLERPWSVVELHPTTPSVAISLPAAWRSICDLIAEQVAGHAAEVALAHGARERTYGELWQRTDALAGVLRARGVGRGDLVAVVVDRGIAFIEAALALWKLGAAYLPLDPSHPARWRAEIAARAGVTSSIAESPAHAIEGLPHFVIGEAIERADPVAPIALVPGELAYVIATSGSTGEPKLVMVEHRGIGCLVHAQRDAMGLGPRARVLQFFRKSSRCPVSSPRPEPWQATSALRGEVPGQQRFTAIGSPHRSQDIRSGIDAVQLRRLQNGIHCGGDLRAAP
jgi:non-ribosomal peptide synthetase component F